MSFIKKYFPIIYVLLALVVFFYVRNVVKQEVFMIDTADKDKENVKDIKPVDVSLNIIGNTQNNTYRLKKENDDTFDDFLESLMDDYGLVFEKTEYTYGTVYDKLNGEIAPEGYVWKVFADDEEFTYNTKGLKLMDGTVYKIILSLK